MGWGVHCAHVKKQRKSAHCSISLLRFAALALYSWLSVVGRTEASSGRRGGGPLRDRISKRAGDLLREFIAVRHVAAATRCTAMIASGGHT